ncbi:MAG: hypothetical protein KatS3mg129_1128 [Leptospiraceae bacterium]|nr:MAG: hypothetical protein KatS3mg129_1128 [Leptospiraceae bacterium]
MDLSNNKKILIIKPGALGDTILSFDLLKNLTNI